MKIINYVTGPIQVNTYVVYDEETLAACLIDPGDYDPAITQKVKELGLTLQYILLTHGHGDHIGGVAAFLKDFPAAKVVAHEAERELLLDGRLNSSKEIYRRDITVDADIWVKDRDTINVGKLAFTVLFTPGHTPGGVSYYTDGYVFCGDSLFRRSIGRTDFYGGDFQTLMQSIKQVLFSLPDDTVVLPGHMEATSIGEEKRGNPFV